MSFPLCIIHMGGNGLVVPELDMEITTALGSFVFHHPAKFFAVTDGGPSITWGLYVHIIVGDYMRTILNLNRSKSTWNLDPLADFGVINLPPATGNQVSVEFNLFSRWHTTMSAKDETWTHNFYKEIFPDDDLETLSVPAFTQGLRKWEQSVDADPGNRTFGELERQANGSFKDAELVELLQESTEDVAGTFTYRMKGVLTIDW